MGLMKMKRGEFYYAHLDPTVGSEINKKRPVLIVSNNANNANSSTLTIVPITSNTHKVYPFEVLLEVQDSGLPRLSKAQCHQVRTISKIRITGKSLGSLNQKMMTRINSALKLHLDLN
jgi:mRNA interferase MazF